MPPPPLTSRVPRPEDLFMPVKSYQVEAPSSTSTSSAAPTPSPLPIRLAPETSGPQTAAAADDKPRVFPVPKLRLEIRDLNHAGAGIFLHAINAASVFAACVQDVLQKLYVSPAHPHLRSPPTRSVTLILRDMGGVAYTTGTDLDDDHKEIHLSLRYVAGLPKERHTHEITGVLTHELVHCYQWTGQGQAPGGLIEGIADWVRLRCELAPPHWKRETGGRWDGGYQHTAYFLAYLEGRFGEDTVRRVNESLRTTKYEEKRFWTELLGRPVEQLWEDYREKMKEDGVQAGARCIGPASEKAEGDYGGDYCYYAVNEDNGQQNICIQDAVGEDKTDDVRVNRHNAFSEYDGTDDDILHGQESLSRYLKCFVHQLILVPFHIRLRLLYNEANEAALYVTSLLLFLQWWPRAVLKYLFRSREVAWPLKVILLLVALAIAEYIVRILILEVLGIPPRAYNVFLYMAALSVWSFNIYKIAQIICTLAVDLVLDRCQIGFLAGNLFPAVLWKQ
ncbi:hypothetical protein JX265_012145 [Neoarthrinium moseri]|uniref:Uncharacterized protein n=1 Tax=Neoarthrinium moseri TaxID=1658444 RepID=A0A9P9WBH5_9PEZI|nr:hypothetical protein JX265_012145 [Neoarthrinium moseri]